MKNKQLLKKLLALTFVLGIAHISFAQTNLATGKVSTATDGTDFANAVDGNSGSRWGSNFANISPDMYMNYTIDFDSLVYIDSINYMPFSDRILTYTIQCSFDGETFYDISDQTNNTDGGSLVEKTFDAAWMKYLRFSYIQGSAPAYDGVYVSIYEYGAFGSDNAPDSPDAFILNDVADADVSTTYTSNSISISGLSDKAPAIVLSDDSVKFSVNGGAYSNEIDTVENGDQITVQITTNNQYDTEFSAALFVGGNIDTFNVTTGSADDFPDAFTITDITDANLFGEYISDAFTVSGLTNAATISIASTEEDAAYSINDGAFTSVAGSVSNGDQLKVRLVTGGLYEVNHTATIDINSVTDVFNVTTKALTINAGTNLLLNKTAVASSVNGLETGDLAVDGNIATKWASPPSYPDTLTVDMGASYNVNQVELVPHSQRDYQFKLEGSTDGVIYTLISDETDNREGEANIIQKSFDTVSTQYLRLIITGAATYTGGYTAIYEFRAFSPAVPTLTKATASVKEVSLYPNPVSDQLYISSEATAVQLSIYSLSGQLVKTVVPQGASVNVSELKSGLYMTKIRFEDGTSSFEQIIKQ